jgi:hypothetical protein
MDICYRGEESRGGHHHSLASVHTSAAAALLAAAPRARRRADAGFILILVLGLFSFALITFGALVLYLRPMGRAEATQGAAHSPS